ncbi:MAG: ribonuclease III domain-containing protein [Candidatus Izemoplasmatales bacterium]|nr:ribonuclease III domain-containing protein [Candidatus Izemoplasmatales bacterium]
MANGLSLAYLGDAVYELRIREHLMEKGFGKVADLHRMAIRFTSASGQAMAIEGVMACLSDEELAVFKRGRNAPSTHKPKNIDLATYHQATGFESVLGYLYLERRQERLEELIGKSIVIIEENSG